MRTFRDIAILVALCVAGSFYDQRSRAQAGDGPSDAPDTKRVLLIVADGMRRQEIFRGADSLLVFGDPSQLGGNASGVRDRFWRPTLAERRRALMPFLWSTVAREGTLLGNRDVGNGVTVTNPYKCSYPGTTSC